MEHGDVEKLISQNGNELLRPLLQGYFDLRASREGCPFTTHAPTSSSTTGPFIGQQRIRWALFSGGSKN